MTNLYPCPAEVVDLLLAGQRLPRDLEKTPLMPPLRKPQIPCQCSFRTRVVGDGCPACNPDYWKRFSEQVHPVTDGLTEEDE